MTLADEIGEWDAYHPTLDDLGLDGRESGSRRWRMQPRGLRAHGGDPKLDTPLCYEINRLAAPEAPPDYAYDRLLARWYGDGWETR